MIKDTNMDHYKVDGANFIEYMNDPKIGGFGNWMFANGFNSGVWASTNWISVKDRLPEHGKRYLIYATSGDNKIGYITTTAFGGHFVLSGRRAYWKVTHWMPLPEPPEVSENG